MLQNEFIWTFEFQALANVKVALSRICNLLTLPRCFSKEQHFIAFNSCRQPWSKELLIKHWMKEINKNIFTLRFAKMYDLRCCHYWLNFWTKTHEVVCHGHASSLWPFLTAFIVQLSAWRRRTKFLPKGSAEGPIL